MTVHRSFLETFEEYFCKFKQKRIVYYGIGPKTELLLKTFPDYNVIGLLDRTETSGMKYGTQVISMEEAIKLKPDIIIVVALIPNTKIIFNRIGKICQENNIPLFGIGGIDLFELFGMEILELAGEPYFELHAEAVKNQILKHDIISFDVFDTLIMRQTLVPRDVFDIVGEQAKKRGIEIDDFRQKRVDAEISIIDKIPDLFEIYNNFQEQVKITDGEKEFLIDLEISIEKKSILGRKKMIELFQFAIDCGKRVYLISDMYLPKSVLEEILSKQDIKGYQYLYESCEYHESKSTRLFDIFKDQVKGTSYLHIGDNEDADGLFARLRGMDVFIIKSSLEMLRISSYQEIEKFAQSINERLLLGLFIAKVLNDPFSLYQSGGRVPVVDIDTLGYAFMSPIVSTFMIWLYGQLKDRGYEGVLFGARDGYLIHKLYNISLEHFGKKGIPEGLYLLISRTVCVSSDIKTDSDIEKLAQIPSTLTLTKMLKLRFDIDVDDNADTTLIMKNRDLIFERSKEIKRDYQKYIDFAGVKSDKKYAYFDFVSSGTCLWYLSKLFCINLEGLFFYRSFDIDEEKEKEKQKLPIRAFLVQNLYKNFSYFYENYNLMETVITSPMPSILRIDSDGTPVYAEEKRSAEELAYVNCVQGAILEFFENYLALHIMEPEISISFIDRLFGLIDPKFTVNKCELENKLFLYDEFGLGIIPMFQ